MTGATHEIELDQGPQVRQHERMCIATRDVRPIAELIRFVVGPDGEPVPDLKQKLPGRGIWVTATRAALDQAVKHGAFVRGFKRQVRMPPDLTLRTEQLLEKAVLDALAIAAKAGSVKAGFGKTEDALQREPVVALLHAAEAAADGVRKLEAASRKQRPGNPPVVVRILTAAQLDLALGRPNMIHAALLAGPASDTFLARLERLERFRAAEKTAQPGKPGQAKAMVDTSV
jgi:uncharacterized protein